MKTSTTLLITSLLGVSIGMGAGCSTLSMPQTNEATSVSSNNSAQEQLQLKTGKVTGTVTYPADTLPHLKICAEDAVTKITMGCTEIAPPSGNYSLTIPIGTYHIYSMLTSNAAEKIPTMANVKAYYSEFVTCGLQYTCSSHTPVKVTVEANSITQNINPGDWYLN